ncbi:hypothetical protein AVEN_238995-1 [Araneus ventricosus]|uniref:Uncharacterized protein n=1 Tax=Araneus ventricosus TaxID=182803 RepID=A0A4Y2RBU8_ARAVE|nr:hypothetical protein AVEN_238995-1 [Araneus ventricosus]
MVPKKPDNNLNMPNAQDTDKNVTEAQSSIAGISLCLGKVRSHERKSKEFLKESALHEKHRENKLSQTDKIKKGVSKILQDKNSRIPLIEKDPELKETKYPTPEKMETTAENTEPESRPSIQSSDEAYESEDEGNLK